MKKAFTVILSAFIMLISASAYSAEVTTSTVEDQQAVEVTVYNGNLGMVKEQRKIKIPKGQSELRFMDVSAQIIPSSVNIKSLDSPGSLSVLEQNYEYDLLNSQKLMEKYVGKKIKLYTKNMYKDKEEIVDAEVLSVSGGSIVYKIGKEITFDYPGRPIFPEVPENLILKPTLVWMLESKSSGTQKVEALYLTTGLNWKADYALIIDEATGKADISGWVTIDNISGATYKNAKLKLVAGTINRAQAPVHVGRVYKSMDAMEMKREPQFVEQGFFEYHIYTLQRPSTLKDNQTKQISLLSAFGFPIKKEYVYKGEESYYRSMYRDTVTDKKVEVIMSFDNKSEGKQDKSESGLGIPLPKGVVRMYMKDKDGSLQLIGEDNLDHTPKNEIVNLKAGDAFDIVATRKQMDWKKISGEIYEASFEISIKNHKSESIMVKVVEKVPGDWSLLESSHTQEKKDASTLEFSVIVPRESETKVRYKVRMKF